MHNCTNVKSVLWKVGSLVYFPAAQMEQEEEPEVDVLPCGQTVHFVTPALLESTAFADVSSEPGGQAPQMLKAAFAQ